MLGRCAGADGDLREAADGGRQVRPIGNRAANRLERDVDDQFEHVAVGIDRRPRVAALRDPVERVACDDEQTQVRRHTRRGRVETVPTELELEQSVAINRRVGEDLVRSGGTGSSIPPRG